MAIDFAAGIPLARLLGIQVTHADRELVTGTLLVTEQICTSGGIIHGGTLMAFADSLGAIAASLNLPEGANGTTTTESKTNFLRAAREGTTITATTRPVNVGRRLSVWTTTISNEEGKPVAVVTQTQMVL